MTAALNKSGAAAIGVLNHMEAWEANLVLNFRLWCEGPQGQAQVWTEFRTALPATVAQCECQRFESLVTTLIASARRPLMRHDVGCQCVGSDECVFVNLVRTASDGCLQDAALIAALIVPPSLAEHVALLAGHVGACARRIHPGPAEYSPEMSRTAARLH